MLSRKLCLSDDAGHMSQVTVVLVLLAVFSPRSWLQKDIVAIRAHYHWTLLNCQLLTQSLDLIRALGLQHCHHQICRLPCLRKTQVPALAAQQLYCHWVMRSHHLAREVITFRWWISRTRPVIQNLMYCSPYHLDVYLPGKQAPALYIHKYKWRILLELLEVFALLLLTSNSLFIITGPPTHCVGGPD